MTPDSSGDSKRQDGAERERPKTKDGSERTDRRQLKAPYRKPVLTEYGDLREMTLGPSPGIGESGNPAVFRS
jgi:hypothetical protein